MRLLIAGGGTGGHIYPALAVARSLREGPDRPGAPDLVWVGGHRGLEADLVRAAGIRVRRLVLRSLRTVDLSIHAVLDPARLARAVPPAAAILAAERLKRAHELFMLMESSLPDDNPEAELIRREIAFLRRASPHYVFHEYLEEFNQPVLFRDFTAEASAAGLVYLCDAQSWPSDGAPALSDRIEYEQLQDIISLRKFRRSLLIKSRGGFVPQWRAERLTELSYYADLNSEEELDLATPAEQIFVTSNGTPVRATHPLAKAALMVLAMHYPRALPWAEMTEQAQALVSEHGDADFANVDDAFYAEWLTLLAEQALRCALEPIEILETLPTHPKAHALARAQAERGTLVASLRHTAVELDEVGRALLRSMDGTRDLSQLSEIAAAQFSSDRDTTDLETLRDACERTLWLFYRHGLVNDEVES